MAPLIARFGVARLIVFGMARQVVGYALFLQIGDDSAYMTAMLPTFLLAGLGFALAYGPLNIAATSGIAPEEQGLAGGLAEHLVPVRRRAGAGDRDRGRPGRRRHGRLGRIAARRLPRQRSWSR